MKLLLLILLSLAISGCGAFDRFGAYVTGNAQEVCVDGVAYLQFTSGSSVKYMRDGSIATCKE